MSLLNWTHTQVLNQLDSGTKWTGLTITYAFPTTAAGILAFQGYNEAAGFRAVDIDQQGYFRLAVSLWDDLIPQSFQQTTSSSPFGANIEYAYSSTTAGYAHAGYPVIGSAWFSSVYVDRAGSMLSPSIGQHGFATLMHETGHALGLEHMGNYDASDGVAPAPSSFQDSTVYSIMSYFGPTGPYRSNQVADADWEGPGNQGGFEPQTPMLFDVMAIQAIYGVSTTTRTGDTVYGFASNIAGDPGLVFDFTRNANPILTIFDSAGNDTLNLSGWSSASVVSLVPGVYSSVNSMTNNIVIAYGASIENAVGGTGADVINGNDGANLLEGGGGNDQLLGGGGDDSLTGGAGNDTLQGGDGSDTARFAGNFSAYRISYNAVTFSYSVAGSTTGTDTVSQVELFQFADISRTAEQLSSSDVAAPTLTAKAPADDTTTVAPWSDLVLTFSESVQAGSGNIVIHNANGSVARTIAVTDTSQVSFSGSSVTINPTANLAAGAGYYVNIASGVIRDLAGNTYAGLFGTTAYNFSTAASDSTAPTLSALSPADNATGVAIGANLVATFSEPVQAGSGSITVFNANGTAFATLAATDTSQLNFNGNSLTIDPALALAAGSGYYLNIDAGAVRDLAGNGYAGLGGQTAWNFTTASAGGADSAAPILTTLSPADNATSVATGANLVLTFNENVQAGSGSIVLHFANGAVASSIAVTDTSQVAISGNVVTVNPATDLLAGTAYYVNLAAGVVRDSAGNNHIGVAGTDGFNFTTAQADDYPGNTPGSLSVNGTPVLASISYSGDRDRFAVNLVAGKTYFFELSTATALPAGATLAGLNDPYLQLLSGASVLAFNDDSAGGRNSRIAYTPTSSGQYLLSAADYGTGTGYYTLSASTADARGPTLLGTQPAAAVSPSANLQLHFSDTVQAGTGDVVIRTANGSVARTIAVGDTSQVTFSGNVMTVNPSDDLAWSTGYYLSLAAGVVKDLAGNAFAGLAASTDYGFTTTAQPLTDDFTWDTATAATVTVDGQARSGLIEFADDADLFAVELQAGVSYAFDLVRSAGGLADPYLLFYSPEAEVIDYNDDGGAEGNAHLTYTATLSGTYYLGAVDSASGTGGYLLSATSVQDDTPWSLDTPGVVPVNGAPVAGSVEFASDADLFQVSLVAGTSYLLTLVRTADGLEDPYLQLFDPDANFAAYDDDGAGDLNSAIIYTATRTGVYFLGASDFDSGTGGYTLSAAALADDHAGAFDTTAEVVVNGAAVTGTVNAALDHDMFGVVLTAGHTYVFELTRPADGLADPYLDLYSPAHALLAGNDDGGGAPNARITYTATVTGTHFLDVQDDNAGTGLYTLVATEDSDDDYPWDASTSGQLVVDGADSSGVIESVYDGDLFKVTLEAGHSYVFDLTSTQADGLADPYLLLFDPSLDVAAEDDDGGGGLNASITYTALSGGIYYLGAVDYDQGTGGYTLSASSTVADDYPWSTSTPGVVAVNGAASTGVIEEALDQDLFAVNLEAGFDYSFSLTRTLGGLVDPWLFLYDPELEAVASDDDGGALLNSVFSYTPTASGTYWLGAMDATDLGIGGYTLTATRSDSTAPTLDAVTPTDNASGVAVSANLALDFSEPVRAGSGSIFIYNSNGTLAETIDVDNTSQASFDGNTLTVNPAADFTPGSSYYVTLGFGVVRDMAGNAFAGVEGSGDWNFTVSLPDDYAWGTATTGQVAVNGAAATGAIEGAGDQDLFRVTLAAGTSYLFSLARAAGGLADPYLHLFDSAFNLVGSNDDGSNSLDARIGYTAGASGTYYLGSSDAGAGVGAYSLSAVVADISVPTLTAKSPADNATVVNVAANLVFSFTEAVQAGSGDIVIYNAANGSVARVIGINDPTQVSFSGNTLTVNPATNLSATSGYYVNIASGVITDLAGNPFAGLSGNGAYDFSTAGPGTVVAGNAAAETLAGGVGDDTLTGAGGDDTLSGGGGNDSINGGDGADRVVYGGTRAQYLLAKAAGGFSVADQSGNRDGTDAVQGAETLRFSDRYIDLTMGSRVQGVSPADLKTLEELYVGFFNRVPEAEGLGYWIGQLKGGMSLAAIANEFYAAGVLFDVYSSDFSDAEFIAQVYDYVLGRGPTSANPPDAQGLAYWHAYLNNAAHPEQTEGTMVLQMLSDVHAFFENITDPTHPNYPYQFVAAHLNNKAAVANYYAVQQGLSMNVQADNIPFGKDLVALITPESTTEAIAFIGVNSFNML